MITIVNVTSHSTNPPWDGSTTLQPNAQRKQDVTTGLPGRQHDTKTQCLNNNSTRPRIQRFEFEFGLAFEFEFCIELEFKLAHKFSFGFDLELRFGIELAFRFKSKLKFKFKFNYYY